MLTQQSAERQQRSLKGQFYTEERAVCDLMLALAFQPGMARLLESGCGAGHFLWRMDAWGRALGMQPEIYGVELDTKACEYVRDELKQRKTHSIRLLQADFLSPAIDELGLFDGIIGNPPYIRQEVLKQSALMDKRTAQAYLLKKYADALCDFPEAKILLSGKPDLYVWFVLQAATLLKPGGRLAYITSNSWLNAAFGEAFRKFLMRQFKVLFLLESACERWFPDAAVNSVIMILEKKTENTTQKEPIRVVRLHQPLNTWLPKPDSVDYWHALKQRVEQLENADSLQSGALTIRELWLEAAWRSGRREMLPSASRVVQAANWTLAMRAPESLLALLQQSHCWGTVADLGAVRYPLKTGINRFFYLSRTQAAEWGLEPEFLVPVAKSLRHLKHYRMSDADCETLLFSCLASKQALEAQSCMAALQYILWGESQWAAPRQKRAERVRWPQVATVRQNKPFWYSIKRLSRPDLLCSRFYDERFFFPACEGDLVEDQTFYGLTLFPGIEKDFAGGLLNSTLFWCVLEFSGRTNLGEGVLQFSRGDVASLLLPAPSLYSQQEREQIAECFRELCKRAVRPVREEVLLADRMALDLAVIVPLLQAAGWVASEAVLLREALIDALLARMAERKNIAGRGKRRIHTLDVSF